MLLLVTNPRPTEEAARRPSSSVCVLSFAVLVTAAIGAGAVVAWLLSRGVDRTLRVSTDIIGYPIFHGFNPSVYEEWYQLAVVVFPVVSAVVFFTGLALWRRMRLPLPSWAQAVTRSRGTTVARDPSEGWSGTTEDRPSERPALRVALLASVARLFLVGGILGAALTIARGDAGWRLWRDIALVAAVYTSVVTAGSALALRRHSDRQRSRLRFHARVNAMGGAATLIGLVAASQATQVTVASDREVHHYAWLPMWLGLSSVVVALVIVAVALSRAGDEVGAVTRIERRAVFLVGMPVALFLVVAGIPGELSVFQAFEDGQSLTTLRLVQTGGIPWRDWISTHGILEDALQPLLSAAAVQDTNWGLAAGRTLFGLPLCILGYYFLAYRAIGLRWLLAPVVGLLIFLPAHGVPLAFERFALWPFLLVLLWTVLDRRQALPAIALGACLAIQAVVSPEAAYCVAAAGLVILARDLYATGRRRSHLRLRGFATSLWTTTGGVAVSVVLLAFLISQHALGDFINYYTAFAPGHILTGGIPHEPLTGIYVTAALLPVAAILLAFGIVLGKAWLRLRMTTLDWVMVATAVLEFLYYPKFLDRADEHVWEVFATAVPLFITLLASLLVASRAVQVTRQRRPGRPQHSGRALPAMVVIVGVLLLPATVGPAVAAAPAAYRVQANKEPIRKLLGYALPGAIDPALVSDLSIFLHAYLPTGGHVFDFTNEPGLLYYLLDFRPSTAYYNVSIAMRDVIQRELVRQLGADPPLFVVFAQGEVGLPEWDDVPNMVRHYDVSEYILSHYHPFADVHGQTIYVRDGVDVPQPQSLNLPLAEPPVVADLPFRSFECDWGRSPDYLSLAPPAVTAGAVPIAVDVTRQSQTSLALAIPSGHRWADYHWIELDARSRLTTSKLTIQDEPSPAGEQRAITFLTSPQSPAAYRFPIGACGQWSGYGSQPLQLTMTVSQDIGAIRLLP